MDLTAENGLGGLKALRMRPSAHWVRTGFGGTGSNHPEVHAIA
jgi:hypothetical protein